MNGTMADWIKKGTIRSGIIFVINSYRFPLRRATMRKMVAFMKNYGMSDLLFKFTFNNVF